MPSTVGRRKAMKLVGLAGLAGALPGEKSDAHPSEASVPEPAPQAAAVPAAAPVEPRAFTFFTPAEAAFVEAAVARLIPADELGPGAREAGCAYFIDQQLAGAFGGASRWYMQGPFGEATPEQGYQLPLTPCRLYRLAIERINLHCTTALGATYDRLPVAAQDEVLRALEQGRLGAGDLPQQTFFEMLLDNTVEGFFADPIYGGNRDKVGWRLVGFPGVAAAYSVDPATYNTPYRVEPVSIADVVRGQAELDGHGHPVHRAADDPPHGPQHGRR